jgi:hypothetical protein
VLLPLVDTSQGSGGRAWTQSMAYKVATGWVICASGSGVTIELSQAPVDASANPQSKRTRDRALWHGSCSIDGALCRIRNGYRCVVRIVCL